jgi:hypothetical protein
MARHGTARHGTARHSGGANSSVRKDFSPTMGNTTTLTLDDLITTIRSFPTGNVAIEINVKYNQNPQTTQWLVDTEENLHTLLQNVRELHPEHSTSQLSVHTNISSVRLQSGRLLPITGHIKVTLT